MLSKKRPKECNKWQLLSLFPPAKEIGILFHGCTIRIKVSWKIYFFSFKYSVFGKLRVVGPQGLEPWTARL